MRKGRANGRKVGFLEAIFASPDDPAPRLVYADWLEEQGDEVSLNRAEFLRIECQLDTLPRGDRRRRKLQARLRELAPILDGDWWRFLDWSPVDHCVKFSFRCPKRWHTLQLTDDPAVRHCDACDQNVHYCDDIAEARKHAAQGRCVALDTREARLPNGLQFRNHGRVLGRVAPQTPRRIPLGKRAARSETEAQGPERQQGS